MAKTYPFDNFPDRYDSWFEDHEHLYRLELQAVERLIPHDGKVLEVGVGSGKFAVPLSIGLGIEPSLKMAMRARLAGIQVALGIAEALPVKTASLDAILMVTTICFVDDVDASFREAMRVLKPGGSMVIGLVDKNSFLGKEYESRKEQSIFYREAIFYSCSDVLSFLARAGFQKLEAIQTIMPDDESFSRIEPGCGKGGFVVIMGVKPHGASE